jgi:hypothetical protein
MKYAIRIRNNETKEERVSAMNFPYDEDVSMFYLTEGNYACDCNRQLEFARSGSEPEPEGICGESRFTIIEMILEDGTRIPVDL